MSKLMLFLCVLLFSITSFTNDRTMESYPEIQYLEGESTVLSFENRKRKEMSYIYRVHPHYAYLTLSDEVHPYGIALTSDRDKDKNYVNLVFGQLLRSAAKKGDEIYKTWKETKNLEEKKLYEKLYYTLLVTSLMVPLHESSLVHFRTNLVNRISGRKQRGCRTENNNGKRVNFFVERDDSIEELEKKLSNTIKFNEIFINSWSYSPIVKSCKQLRKGNKKVLQLLTNSALADVGIMQINYLDPSHKAHFIDRNILDLAKTMEYGVDIIVDGVRRLIGKYQGMSCLKTFHNELDFYNFVRAIWAGRYNSGSAGRRVSCRFNRDSYHYYKQNDFNFRRMFDRLLFKDDTIYHKYLTGDFKIAFEQLIEKYKSFTFSKYLLKSKYVNVRLNEKYSEVDNVSKDKIQYIKCGKISPEQLPKAAKDNDIVLIGTGISKDKDQNPRLKLAPFSMYYTDKYPKKYKFWNLDTEDVDDRCYTTATMHIGKRNVEIPFYHKDAYAQIKMGSTVYLEKLDDDSGPVEVDLINKIISNSEGQLEHDGTIDHSISFSNKFDYFPRNEGSFFDKVLIEESIPDRNREIREYALILGRRNIRFKTDHKDATPIIGAAVCGKLYRKKNMKNNIFKINVEESTKKWLKLEMTKEELLARKYLRKGKRYPSDCTINEMNGFYVYNDKRIITKIYDKFIRPRTKIDKAMLSPRDDSYHSIRLKSMEYAVVQEVVDQMDEEGSWYKIYVPEKAPHYYWIRKFNTVLSTY